MLPLVRLSERAVLDHRTQNDHEGGCDDIATALQRNVAER